MAIAQQTTTIKIQIEGPTGHQEALWLENVPLNQVEWAIDSLIGSIYSIRTYIPESRIVKP